MDTRKWHRAGMGAIVFLLIVALAASVAACASANATAGPLKLANSDNGKSFTVKVGDTIKIVLPGNTTTGYAWAAALGEKDAAILVANGEPAYADGNNGSVVGAGGTFTFDFRAAKAGQATLRLLYQRPWENGVAAAQTFQVTITVK